VTEPEILVEIVRSGHVEGHHRGSVVALRADGAVDWTVGDAWSPIYPRSCNKPVQALGMLRLGLDLEGELLALCAASHSGEPFHVDGVRRILAGAGLDESALQTPPDYPLDDRARVDFIRAGREPAPIAMNCSGKHAGMLATCVANGWPTASYLDPQHPLQTALAGTFSELTGEPVESTGVDGCGGPLFAASLVGLARAFHRLAVAAAGTPERRVVHAFTSHPAWASGTHRDEARTLRALPGAIAKAGAEACYALALPDGRAVALKIDDGSPRARPPVMAATLAAMGVDTEPGVDGAALREAGVVLLTGGGRPVGELRVVHPALVGGSAGVAVTESPGA
jgi:L-asparaginase II